MSKEMSKASKEVASFKATNDVSAIRQDLKNLKEDTASLIQHSKEEGREQLLYAEEKAKEALKSAKSVSKDQYAEIESFVRSNPGQSIALAFGAGILASFFLGRGR